MGRTSAVDFANTADLSQGLYWHLTANHYPPVPVSLIPACIDAVQNCAAGLHRETVTLPVCISYKGSQDCPAWALVEHLHLQPWVDRVSEHDYDYDYDPEDDRWIGDQE